MNFSDWSTVAEIISAVAVIITLLYLAIQVHGNTRQLKSQVIEASREGFLHHLDATTKTIADADIFRRGLNQFDELSENEQACFHSLIHPLVHGFHSVWNLRKSSVLEEQDFLAMKIALVRVLVTTGGRQWWDKYKFALPPHLTEHLEATMDNRDSPVAPATEKVPWLRMTDG
jgi:hypothetical protein